MQIANSWRRFDTWWSDTTSTLAMQPKELISIHNRHNSTEENPFKAPFSGRYERMFCADDPKFGYLLPPDAGQEDFPEHSSYMRSNARRYDQLRIHPEDHSTFRRSFSILDARTRQDDDWDGHRFSQGLIDHARNLTVAAGHIDLEIHRC